MKPYRTWHDALQAAVNHPHFGLVAEHIAPEIVGNPELLKALNELLRALGLPPFIAIVRPAKARPVPPSKSSKPNDRSA